VCVCVCVCKGSTLKEIKSQFHTTQIVNLTAVGDLIVDIYI
jgi:hypothetical protein